MGKVSMLGTRKIAPALLLLASATLFGQQGIPPPANPAPNTQPTVPAETPTSTKPPAVQPMGGPVKRPEILRAVDPSFTEEARMHCIEGKVLVNFIVEKNGDPSHIRVAHGLGYGLDEAAVAAVGQYKFQPGMRDGEPVRVAMAIEINFQQPNCH